MEEILAFEGIEYGYNNGRGYKILIKNACGIFFSGRVYAVMGQAPDEKAVLLALLSGLEKPEKGRILFKGADIGGMGRDLFRRKHAGLLLQAYPCLPRLSVLQNAMLSMEGCGGSRKELKSRIAGLLEQAGLDPAKNSRRASGLSFMEQQAVSLVRTLGPEPPLLLIEEKDWDSDPGLERGMTGLLHQAAYGRGACVVIATNSRNLLDRADEVWGMKQGILLPLKTQ